ncbi:Nitroreductase [Desulfonispora thiosulfatigenes DSM 11270]|uniref:Nitroreductase n=1 Tax=Desulfonispora thiosulfatigenes DSM 11270 TaxID=656914 RepID=A0A1W1V1G7_DESTI|nr:nitroreductase family protein [Desulfonispora thiosulfatigenes]SMB87195.1 Nitroreductase [Desulfonispora thiosulfatigenes DSM 11270]
MKEILNRRSIRQYTDRQVSDELIDDLLKAAMAAPSAGNERPWEFIVVRDKKTLSKIIEVHPNGSMMATASVAIVVCGNLEQEKYEGYWVQDVSAATQNILLAGEHFELGSVWLGVHPNADMEREIGKILSLPETIIPFSIIPVGYPGEYKPPTDRYDYTKIHYDQW